MLSCSKHWALHCSFMVFRGHTLNFSSVHYEDELGKALQVAKLMDQGGPQASRDIIYNLLQRCSDKKDLNSGRYVHCLMVNHGLDFIAPLADHLIRLFMLCGSLVEANGVFLHVSKPSIFTWNAIISAHANLSEGSDGMDLFVEMQQGGLKPDKVTFLCVIKCCSNMQDVGCGRVLHDQVMRSNITLDAAIGNTIVDMYMKCGSLEEARAMFDVLPDRDNVSWGVMIAGYVTHDLCEQALQLFTQMPEEEALSSSLVLSCTLKACGRTKALDSGRLVHNAIEKLCLKGDILIGSALVIMYSCLGLLDDARKVFDQVQGKNLNMWGEMVGGYADHGFCDEALEVFESMLDEGLKPDKFSCLRVLKACGSLEALKQGRLMYDHIIRSGLDSDTMVMNTLIDVFAKCGSLMEAGSVFSVAKVQDVVSWSVLIAGYAAQQGDGHVALELFQNMQLKGFTPSKVSYLGAMKACGSVRDLHKGRKIHDEIANTGLMADMLIGSTLIDMYAKCGSLKEAREVFDALPNRNVVIWGAMIAGYAQHGLGIPALELFKRMQTENHRPDKVLYSSVLQACTSIESLCPGRFVHDQIIRDGFDLQIIVGNTLIDLYAKCGSVDEARAVFDRLTDRDVVTWATMITGYAYHGHGLTAFQLFEISQEKGIKLNRVVFLGLLRACGSMRTAVRGQVIHNCLMKEGLDKDPVVCNTLLDMYAKSGNLKEARAVFDRMQHRDGVSWSVLISGYAWQCEWGHVL